MGPSISKSSNLGLDPIPLQKAMTKTHPTDESFKKFKSAVERHYRTLNLRRRRDEQDPHEWQSFLKEVVSNDPALLLYDNCWPVEIYFDFLVKNHVRPTRSTRQTSHLPVIPKPPGNRKFYPLTTQLEQAMKVTHPTPCSFEKFKKAVRGHMDILDCKYRPEQPHDSWQDFLQAVLSSEPSLKGRYEDCWTIEYYFNLVIKSRIKKRKKSLAVSKSRLSVKNSVGTSTSSASSSSTITHTDTIQLSGSPEPKRSQFEEEMVNCSTLISSCFLCQPPTSVDPSSNKKLAALFANDSEILQTLASFGIRLDQHLDALLRMDNSVLERLVVSIPSKELGLSAKYRVLILLEQAREKHACNPHAFNDTIAIAQLPCLVHHMLDISMVSSVIRKSLQFHGLGELMPAFALMGLSTEEDFNLFCKSNEYSRSSLLKSKKVHLSRFQEFMLNLAFG